MATKRLSPLLQLEAILNSFTTVDWKKEYKFHNTRRWRIDYAGFSKSTGCKLCAVEYEGGAWSKGRHTRPKGFINDCDKYNELSILGWTLLRYTSEHLKDPDIIINQIRRVIALK